MRREEKRGGGEIKGEKGGRKKKRKGGAERGGEREMESRGGEVVLETLAACPEKNQ